MAGSSVLLLLHELQSEPETWAFYWAASHSQMWCLHAGQKDTKIRRKRLKTWLQAVENLSWVSYDQLRALTNSSIKWVRINLRDRGFDGLGYTLINRISETFAAARLQERQKHFLEHGRRAQDHQRQSVRWILKLMSLWNNCIVPSYLCGNIRKLFQMYFTHNEKKKVHLVMYLKKNNLFIVIYASANTKYIYKQ